MKKLSFPALIIFLLLIVDGFLMNDLPLEENIKFPDFKTETLSGEEVTEKIFAEKITILCIWTPKQENFEVLSELEALKKNLPADVQIIGLAGNNFEVETARKIAEKYSPSVPQLKVNDDFFPVLEKIRTVPTTIFIDKSGILIGQPAGGADTKFVRRELDYILKKKSPQFLAAEKIHENILYR